MKFSVVEEVKLIDLESIVMLHHQMQFVISINFLKAKNNSASVTLPVKSLDTPSYSLF